MINITRSSQIRVLICWPFIQVYFFWHLTGRATWGNKAIYHPHWERVEAYTPHSEPHGRFGTPKGSWIWQGNGTHLARFTYTSPICNLENHVPIHQTHDFGGSKCTSCFKGVDSNGDVFGETWGYFGSKLCNNCFHPKINHGMCRSSSPPEFLLGEILIFGDPEPKESWWVFWHPVCDLRWGLKPPTS